MIFSKNYPLLRRMFCMPCEDRVSVQSFSQTHHQRYLSL
jgi:hypothetical protein